MDIHCFDWSVSLSCRDSILTVTSTGQILYTLIVVYVIADHIGHLLGGSLVPDTPGDYRVGRSLRDGRHRQSRPPGRVPSLIMAEEWQMRPLIDFIYQRRDGSMVGIS